MAVKIMLVEDDTNLSDIYKARLEAEGFQIIIANDGEAALALAVKEHPDLIISDVMMPKISGFEMLDILRGTDGIKDTKVIMMTALGQSEDKSRADKLGADRYLVKSQVTLEDVVKAVHDVLADGSTPAAVVAAAAPVTDPASTTPTSPAEPVVAQIPVTQPQQTTTSEPPVPVATIPVAAPQVDPAVTVASDTSTSQAAVLTQIKDFADKQESTSQPAAAQSASTTVTPTLTEADPATEPRSKSGQGDGNSVTIANKKIIKPISDPATKKPGISELLAREEGSAPTASSTDGIFAAQAGNVVAPSGSDTTSPSDPTNFAL